MRIGILATVAIATLACAGETEYVVMRVFFDGVVAAQYCELPCDGIPAPSPAFFFVTGQYSAPRIGGERAAVSGHLKVTCPGVPAFANGVQVEIDHFTAHWIDPAPALPFDTAAISAKLLTTLPADSACTVSIHTRDQTSIDSELAAFTTAPVSARLSQSSSSNKLSRVVSFNTKVDPAAVQRGVSVRRVRDGALVTADLTLTGSSTLTLDLLDPIEPGEHEIVLADITDLYGIAMPPRTLPFTLE